MRHTVFIRLSVDETIDIMSESSLPESLVGDSYKKEDKNDDGFVCEDSKADSPVEGLYESPPNHNENEDDNKDCINSLIDSGVENECNRQSKCTA